jgi:flavin-dependent dehydrogenase
MSAPIVVVGGGPAGAAASCLLAQAGREVLVLERERQATPKVCGEFLSCEAVAYLGRLEVDVAALGAEPIGRLRLVNRTAIVEAALPFRGAGLSRATLDAALLRRAAECGAEVRRGATVVGVGPGSPLVVYLGGGGELSASGVLLATGKHDLRGLRRPPGQEPGDLVGFKLHFRLAAAQHCALLGHVEIVMFPDGYAGLQPVEGGAANLCLLVDRTRLRDAGGTWDGLIADLRRREPHLALRLAGAVAMTERPVSIYRVPFGFVHQPGSEHPSPVFRLGDQMGVIASFTGDGLSIALHSAVVAAASMLDGRPAGAYHDQMRRDVSGQIRKASALYRLGRRAGGQRLLMRLGNVWPRGLVGVGAMLTRVPPRSVSRAWSQIAPYQAAGRSTS